MASFSDTLTAKHGGVPTYVMLLGGVGVLVLVMFLRARSQASKTASNTASQTANSPLQTNVLSPAVATSLSQGAAPMAYMGGNIYNNIANNPTATASATSTSQSTATAPATNPPPAPSTPSPAPAPTPAQPQYGSYTIPQGSGQSYSYVAQNLAPKGTTWQQLYALNTSSNGPHSAQAAAKLASQGPNLLYGGQIVYYPTS